MKYKKLPIPIDALQFTGDALDIYKWMKSFTADMPPTECYQNHMIIKTLEGNHRANRGDWIIRGVRGEFYPCREDIFAETYEEAEDTDLKNEPK